MDCILPPPVTEDQISEVLDGAAPPAVLGHVGQCPSCAARVEQARSLEQALATALYRYDCPAIELLGAYALEACNNEEAEVMRQHLELCTRCTHELAEVRSLLNLDPSTASPSPAPGAEAPRTPEKLRPSLATWVPRLLEEITATLLPRQPVLATRFRPAGVPKALPEPIIAEAGEMTVTLLVEPHDDGHLSLNVQVAEVQDERQEEWKGALVTLRRAQEILAAETLADGVACTFAALSPGLAEVRIASEQGRSVVVPEVELA